MEKFTLREKEIFETLKKIKSRSFVVIGGYAVNAYTLPRFSVDCDIVVKNREDLANIEEDLLSLGYKRSEDTSEVSYEGKFERYEKEIIKNFKVSVDILIEEVRDRNTNSIFSADWVFSNSGFRKLRGKTISEELNVRIVNPDALFAMKLSSCRINDIRDLFLLVELIKDGNWIKKEVSLRYNFKERISKVMKEITSKQFKDNLQGVFGFVDKKVFEKSKKMIIELSQ